jgi:WD40 repeat protein/transcriptional regulator with XRE-family HTH domain
MNTSDAPESFRGLLLRHRGRTGLIQRDLATRVGISRGALQDWEAGVSYPTADRLRALIRAVLDAGGMIAGRETSEARELWAAAERDAPRMHTPFDEEWFADLLAARAVLNSAPLTDPLNTRPAAGPGTDGAERAQDWGEAPDATVFVGRAEELALLQSWVLEERCRVVAVLGMGGIGKTTLATALAQTVAASFHRVYWRSLRNAPPLIDWLAGAISFLSDQQVVPPPSESEMISALLQVLRARRCLLVLDNSETLFEPGQREGRYRAGMGGYGRLLGAVGEASHQSCLVLTSREAPPDWSRLGGGAVRALELAGLGIPDGQDLLAHKQLSGDATAWANLIVRYGGNGLALKVVGESIRQVFGGDIGVFLSESGPETIFGGIRRLLAEQIERSSPFERDVLRMLAVEREPVSIAELMANLGTRAGRGPLLESIAALRSRSLVERAETHGTAAFTLQSVVLEYMTDQLVEAIADEIASGQTLLLVELPLIKALAKDYVRQTQERLIAQPILKRLESQGVDVEPQLLALLNGWRNSPLELHGYGPGNVVNLLRVLRGDLRSLNLGRLGLRQVYLAGVDAQDASLAGAHLLEAVLAESFIYPIRLGLSANGALLLAGTSSGEIWLWRVSDHTPLLALQAHQGPVHGVAITADGHLLASAGEDGTIRVWSFDPSTLPALLLGTGAATSAKLVTTLHGHASAVLSVAMAPAGNLLVSGGLDGTVRVWDPVRGQLLATLEGHTGPVHGVALTANGQLLASCSQDGTVRQWFIDLVQGGSATRPLSESRGHSGPVRGVALSADGEMLASAGLDGTIRLWAPMSGQLQATLSDRPSGIWGVAVSADGHLLADASFDGTARLWQTNSGLPLLTLQGHSSGVRDVSMSAVGALVATCSWDGSIGLWEATSGRRLATLLGVTSGVWDIALSPDGQLLVSGSSDGSVRVWEASDGRLLSTLRGHTAGVRCVALSVDGRLIASGGLDGTLRLWDLRGERLLATLHGDAGPIYAAKFSANARLLASGSEDGSLRLWSVDGANARLIATLRGHTGGIRAVTLSADGLLVASCSWDGTARLWDVATGRPLATLEPQTVYAVALSPDKRLLASGGEDGIIRLWEVETGKTVFTFEGSAAGICGIDWSADGQKLASGTSDGTIHLWDVPGRRRLMTLEGHTDVVRGVALAAERGLLASGSHDGTLRLWDTSTGRCLRVMRSDRTYERVDVTGLTGVTGAQRASLLTLGAIDHAAVPDRPSLR